MFPLHHLLEKPGRQAQRHLRSGPEELPFLGEFSSAGEASHVESTAGPTAHGLDGCFWNIDGETAIQNLDGGFGWGRLLFSSKLWSTSEAPR